MHWIKGTNARASCWEGCQQGPRNVEEEAKWFTANHKNVDDGQKDKPLNWKEWHTGEDEKAHRNHRCNYILNLRDCFQHQACHTYGQQSTNGNKKI